MALDTRKKRRKRLSLTSLIDVIFLLLLFFMLSSTFSQFGEIELTSAGAGGSTQESTIRFLKLEAERITLDGKPLPFDQLGAALQSDKQQTVLISLEKEASSQQLIDLLTVLRPMKMLQTRVLG